MLGEVSRRLVNSGLSGKPAALAMLAKHFVGFGRGLPDPEKALRHPEGLAGPLHDISVPTLVAAYARGLYPEAGKWWAPAKRMVSFLEKVYVSKRVSRLLQTRTYGVSFDEDFAGVLRGCALEQALAEAFQALFEDGYAHSVEVWDRAGRLVGGLFGLAIGEAFFTETMFSRKRDAANVGLVTLTCHLQHWGFALNAGKRINGQLSQLGFQVVLRFAFNEFLSKATHQPSRAGRWCVETGLDPARWNPKVPGRRRATPQPENVFTLPL